MNPSFNQELGLLVEGCDSPPTFMMPYNPRYYEELIENYGFTKEHDLYAYFGHVDQLETQDKKLQFIVDESTRRFNFKLRRMNMSNFDQEVRTFLKIYNEAHGDHWGFIPLSENEIKHMSKSMRFLMTPEMTTVAEVDGRVVGTAFGMLDYNPLIKQIDGRLFPFGFLRLMLNRKRIKRMRLIAAHVLPEYQRWGLGVVLLSRLVPDALAWGIEEAEFSWVAESNHLSRASLERGDAKRSKTYRIYDSKIK
ncbi:MAG: GNAT family N-acetyltransferase [Planctomycetes bacterium]|nr:GNAT family N-acetyltransferase [Planctomycetota bacterium]